MGDNLRYQKALALSHIIRATPRPNTSTQAYELEEVLSFAVSVEKCLAEESDKNLHSSLQTLLAVTPEVDIDPAIEAREHVEIIFNFTRLRNEVLKIVDVFWRESSILDSISRESDEHYVSDILTKINKIEKIIEDLKFDAESERIDKSIHDDLSVNLFFLSVPLKSIRSAIRVAKEELNKRSPISYAYVSNILEKASAVASNIWDTTKSIIGHIPTSVSSRVHAVALSTAKIASDSMILLIRARIRTKNVKVGKYSKEADAIRLNYIRHELINMIEDYRQWEPIGVDYITNSVLFKFIYYDLSVRRFNQDIVAEINRDLEKFHTMSVSVLQYYVIEKAEIVLRRVSGRLFDLEREIEDSNKNKE